MKRAVIDIGSNSIRLYIEPDSFGKESIVTGLGKQKRVGSLTRTSIDESVKVICDFAATARRKGATEVCAYATEAIRSAKDAQAFIQTVKAASGITVNMINGRTESRIGAYGALMDFNPRSYVIDIGGGSTELSRSDGEVNAALSLPLGTHNLKRIAQDIDELSALLPHLLIAYRNIKDASIHNAVAIGGTPGSVAAVALDLKEYAPSAIHGYNLTAQAIEAALPLIRDKEKLLARYPFIGKRAEVLPYGATMLLALMRYLELDRVTCSEKDGMEGYLALIDGLI